VLEVSVMRHDDVVNEHPQRRWYSSQWPHSLVR
jgi:hypothetical protein